jgi:hypothetical protein
MNDDKVILINESKRAFSLPSRPLPSEQRLLNERGRPRGAGLVDLERVKVFRPPLLEPEQRIEVPGWYVEELRKIKALRTILGKRDGIAVGRTRDEATREEARAAAAARTAQLVEATRTAEARAQRAEAEAAERVEAAKASAQRVAELERELAKLKSAAKADEKPKS